MPEVPKLRTPLEPLDAGLALQEAWLQRFGAYPTPEVLRLLVALSDLETATWQRMWNHNFGNQIATTDAQAAYLADDSGNLRRFRSYDSAEEGALSFVRQLTSDTRPQWHAGLLTGDPVEFARALKGLNGGPAYYEADLGRYTSGLVARWERYDPEDDAAPDTERLPPPKARPRKRGNVLPLFALVALSVTLLAVSRSSNRARQAYPS